jgi:phage terminase large subunit-like protein
MPRRATRPGSSRIWVPERSPEKHTLEHFERFAFTLELPDDRGPFRLQPYMCDALEDYFAGILENLWLWPTGQAKSTLLAALGLHHGTYVRASCKVFILGGLGGHGRNTLDAATGFIDRSRDLQRIWASQEYAMGRIKSRIDRGVILVSSAGRRVGGRGGSSQEGEDPTLILVEEPHRHEDNGAAVRTLTTKLQKRTTAASKVQIVHGSTAGDDYDSFLGRLVRRVTDEANGAIVETDRRPGIYYRRAIDADGDLVMHELAVPEHVQPPPSGAKPADIDAYLAEVKKANPADFITVKNLRVTFKACSAEPWVFLRQNANQWVTQDQTALNRFGWTSRAKPGLEIPLGATGVYVGLDTASKWATTAITPVWVDPETNRPRTAHGQILKSSRPGHRRRMRDVIDQLLLYKTRWPTMRLVFDRNWGGGLVAEQFEEDHGLIVVDHGQGVAFDLASMLLGELVDQQAFDHDDNPEITAQVLAAVAKPTAMGRRWRGEQGRDKRCIDAFDSIAMATNMALNPPDEEKPVIDISRYRIKQL